MAGRPNNQIFHSSLPRLSEEIRLLRSAKKISEFPKQLLRKVEEEIGMYYKNAQACRQRMASLPRTTAGLSTIAELELPLALSERNLIIALRARRAYYQERMRILRSMAVNACGQFDAFDEDLLEKLSDREKFTLKKFCEVEHRRRERLAWRIAAERNGKFSATADVVFEKDCFLEDPWTYVPPGDDDDDGEDEEVGGGGSRGGEQGGEEGFWRNGDTTRTSGERGGRLLKLYTAGRICRFPLYQAEQLQARRLVRLLRSSNTEWLPHSQLPL